MAVKYRIRVGRPAPEDELQGQAFNEIGGVIAQAWGRDINALRRAMVEAALRDMADRRIEGIVVEG